MSLIYLLFVIVMGLVVLFFAYNYEWNIWIYLCIASAMAGPLNKLVDGEMSFIRIVISILISVYIALLIESIYTYIDRNF